jgi:hypothetical protein
MGKYKYFVSFQYTMRNESGFGNFEVSLFEKIQGQEQIRKIEKYIEETKNFHKVIVLWYQKL